MPLLFLCPKINASELLLSFHVDARLSPMQDNTLPDVFEFEIESTCLDPDSDLLQIAQAGGDIDTC